MSSGFWLYALFISANVYYCPFVFVSITCYNCILVHQLKSEKHFATMTILKDSLFARIMTGFIYVFVFVFCSLLTSKKYCIVQEYLEVWLLCHVCVLEFYLRATV